MKIPFRPLINRLKDKINRCNCQQWRQCKKWINFSVMRTNDLKVRKMQCLQIWFFCQQSNTLNLLSTTFPSLSGWKRVCFKTSEYRCHSPSASISLHRVRWKETFCFFFAFLLAALYKLSEVDKRDWQIKGRHFVESCSIDAGQKKAWRRWWNNFFAKMLNGVYIRRFCIFTGLWKNNNDFYCLLMALTPTFILIMKG